MENKTIDEVEDNSIGAVLHQGKTIAQWEKILKKDLNLTQEQILKLVRAGVDLDRMLLGLDETENDEVNEDAFNDPAFKDEKFFFNEDEELDEASIKDYIMPTLDYKVLDAATGDEIWETRIDPSDAKWIVPYIGEFIYGKQSVLMLNDRKLLDKLVPGQKLKCMLFVDGKPCAMDKNVLKHQVAAIEERIAKVAANTYKFKDSEKAALSEAEMDEIAESFNALSEDIKSNIATFAAGAATMQALGKDKDGKQANPNNLIGPAAMLMATASANKDIESTRIMQKAFSRSTAAANITDAQLCLLALVFEAGENGIVWPEIKKALAAVGKTRLDISREMRALIKGDLVDKDFNFFSRNVYSITRRGKKVLAQNGYDSARMRALSDVVKKNIEDYDKEPKMNESIGNDPEDVVTVEDFMKLLRANAKLDDKVMFRSNKQEIALFDINTKAGITVVDFIDNKPSDRLNEDDDSSNVNETEIVLDQFYDHECLSVKDFKSLGQKAFPYNSSAWESMTVAGIINGKVIEFPKAYCVKSDHSPDAGTVFLLDGTDASQQTYDKDLSTLFGEEKSIKESHSWRGGGYGGTGRAYSSLGSKAPRGEEIGWYKVSDLDPKATGKMPSWRCGPSNFPFNDALYGIGTGRLDPDGKSRKYKVGTMIMRNKHVNAGSASGIVDIAVPSYFAAIKSNDEDAIAMLKLLGIPLDLTFGMDPNDDYSVTYTAIG